MSFLESCLSPNDGNIRIFTKSLLLCLVNSANHEKSKTGIVPGGITQLATDTLSFIAIESAFPL